MSDPPIAMPPLPIELTDDLLCTRCGYNLRGLKQDGLCPECFTAIIKSLETNRIRNADPRWLQAVHNGLTFLLMRWITGIPVALAYTFGGMRGWSATAIGLTFAVLEGLGVAGVFLLTSPDPTRTPRPSGRAFPVMVRLAACFQLLTVVVQRTGTFPQFGMAAALLAGGLTVSAGVVAVGQFVYLRQLAAKAARPRMAAETTIVMYGYSVPVVFACTCAAISTLVVGFMASPMIDGLFTASLALVWIFSIWYVALLVRYRRVLAAVLITHAPSDEAPQSGG